ncbi:MAG: AraC family transcriptional regulator, partial [Acetatifactor sp.]|nr:AraC family transcriptional regulator [Acetatifactor sp.]
SKLLQMLYRNRQCPELLSAIEEIFSCSSIKTIERTIATAVNTLKTSQSDKEDNTRHAVQLVKQYINTHYDEDISLNSLADQVYLNTSYLSRIFKTQTGHGINKYIKTVRMEKAKELLQKTNMKIADIGCAVGFHNNSYFIKSFHEYYGKTPEKMRNKEI